MLLKFTKINVLLSLWHAFANQCSLVKGHKEKIVSCHFLTYYPMVMNDGV